MFTSVTTPNSLNGVVSLSLIEAGAKLGFSTVKEMDEMFVMAYDHFSLDDDRSRLMRIYAPNHKVTLTVDMRITPAQIRSTFASPIAEPLITAIQEVQRKTVYWIANAFGSEESMEVIQKQQPHGEWVDYKKELAIAIAKLNNESSRAVTLNDVDASTFTID